MNGSYIFDYFNKIKLKKLTKKQKLPYTVDRAL